jgi:Ca2+-binding RTX toxin-like protein
MILLGAFSGSAATNSVSQASLDDITSPITANDLKPPECAVQHVTNLIVDLILGGSGDDTISGEGGNDCIAGGDGGDLLIGNAGNDMCIGGPGTDMLDATCERAEQ